MASNSPFSRLYIYLFPDHMVDHKNLRTSLHWVLRLKRNFRVGNFWWNLLCCQRDQLRWQIDLTIVRVSLTSLRTLRKKCLYSEFFWSVLFRIWPEYGDLRSKSLYSVQMQEKTDQITPNTDTFYAVRTPCTYSELEIVLSGHFFKQFEMTPTNFEDLLSWVLQILKSQVSSMCQLVLRNVSALHLVKWDLFADFWYLTRMP